MSLLKKYHHLPTAERQLVREAFFLCLRIRLMFFFLPFRWYSSWLGKPGVTEKNIPQISQDETINAVRIAVARVVRNVYPHNSCLLQSLAVKKMLKKRNIVTTLFLGISRNNNRQIIAHSWLQCGTQVVIGEDKTKNYSVLSNFT